MYESDAAKLIGALMAMLLIISACFTYFARTKDTAAIATEKEEPLPEYSEYKQNADDLVISVLTLDVMLSWPDRGRSKCSYRYKVATVNDYMDPWSDFITWYTKPEGNSPTYTLAYETLNGLGETSPVGTVLKREEIKHVDVHVVYKHNPTEN